METDVDQLTLLANHMRLTNPTSSTNQVFSISTSLLSRILTSSENVQEENMSTVISYKRSSSVEAELHRDIKYLYNYIKSVRALKLYNDSNTCTTNLDLAQLDHLVNLELYKVNASLIKGILKLRHQLQKLTCHKTLNGLDEVLCTCGADKSHVGCWNSLKEISFTNNNLAALDESFEYTPWLHTVDLSHNQISNIDSLSILIHLKQVNLSYNKLEVIPFFRGQICSRLQNVILKNNFIEDIHGLQSLVNLWVLDLSNNCLVDHKCLLAITHSATLQWLNLAGNPLSFHPHHRLKTASYLHKNTGTTRFVLDNAGLNKSEKKAIGTLHPMQMMNFASFSESYSVATDKMRKVREVVIEEENCTKPTNIPVVVAASPPQPKEHLQTKKQIEDLRDKYGDSWLKLDSGVLVQNVMGLENCPLPLSSSPYELDFLMHCPDDIRLNNTTITSTDAGFETAQESTIEQDDTFATAPIEETDNGMDSDNSVSEGNVELEGDEHTYFAHHLGKTKEFLIVITKYHLGERELGTLEEKIKWHIHSVSNCTVIEDDPFTVQLDFDTMRKDRKQRTYVIQTNGDEFVGFINEKLTEREPVKDSTRVEYECMKCSIHFVKDKEFLLSKPTLRCPSCDSNLIVESS